jgi:hypothetical protein
VRAALKHVIGKITQINEWPYVKAKRKTPDMMVKNLETGLTLSMRG